MTTRITSLLYLDDVEQSHVFGVGQEGKPTFVHFCKACQQQYNVCFPYKAAGAESEKSKCNHCKKVYYLFYYPAPRMSHLISAANLSGKTVTFDLTKAR